MTLFIDTVMRMSPLTCTAPDGTTFQSDNPLGGLPFISGLGQPDNCVDGQSIAGQVVDGIWGPGTFQAAVANTVKSASTFWVNQPSPTVADPTTHVLTGAAANLNNSLLYITLLVFIVCITIKGAQIAWAGAHGGEPMMELAKGIWDWIIAAGVVAGIVGVVLVFTDQVSTWLIDQATNGGGFADNLNAFMSNPALIAGMANVAAYGILGLAFLFALLQELLFAARGGGLVVLLGVYLMSSSAASLRKGRQSHEVLTAWIVGFTLYKLAAACVYAGAFWLIGTPDQTNSGWTILEGVSLMALAIFALWAVIKMAMPAAEPVAGHGFMQTATTVGILAR